MCGCVCVYVCCGCLFASVWLRVFVCVCLCVFVCVLVCACVLIMRFFVLRVCVSCVLLSGMFFYSLGVFSCVCLVVRDC